MNVHSLFHLEQDCHKDQLSLPQIDDLFDHLNGAWHFSWLDLKLGYYQICIMNANVEKMTKESRYGSYKFLVMSFHLCNVPLKFTIHMNSIFHDKLNGFVSIHIDDISISFEVDIRLCLDIWNMFCKSFKIINFMSNEWRVNFWS